MITDKQIEQLNAKLLPEHVSQREGAAGRKLSYIEGHHAIREANRIFGFDGWSFIQLELRLIGTFEDGGKTSVAYSCMGSVEALGVTRQDTGYGDGTDRNALKAHELAVKEAVTDARKRCLMMFGDQFGLALYDKAQTHVEKPGKAPEKPTALAQYMTIHVTCGFPPFLECGDVLKELVGKNPGDKLAATDWEWLIGWAERYLSGLEDVPVAWTDRVTKALSNGDGR